MLVCPYCATEHKSGSITFKRSSSLKGHMEKHHTQLHSSGILDTAGLSEMKRALALEVKKQKDFLRRQISPLPLWAAASHGNADQLKAELVKGVDINAKDSEGDTALSRAAKAGHFECVNVLLQYGAVTKVGDEVFDVLRGATRAGDTQMVQLLLTYGVNVNGQNTQCLTPLHIAPDLGMAELLISFGANVDHEDLTGRTALHAASSSGNQEIVQLLLDLGADVDARDRFNQRPIDHALRAGYLDAANSLLLNGARMMNITRIPSLTYRYFELVKKKQRTLAAGDRCILPLGTNDPDTAISLGNSGKLLRLIFQGPDLTNHRDAIMEAFQKSYEDIMELVLDSCMYSSSELMGFIFSHYSDVSLLNMNTRMLRRRYGAKVSVLLLLAETKPSELADTFSYAAILFRAAITGDVDIFRFLLGYGGSLNLNHSQIRSALYGACELGHIEIVRLILEREAYPHRAFFVAPLDLATKKGHRDVSDLLMAYVAANCAEDVGGTATDEID